MDKKKLDGQAKHWDNVFSERVGMFGISPSDAALKAAEIFQKQGINNILELGAGQGRDTIFFAKNGFNVQVLDYSQSGINSILERANREKLLSNISARQHDIRKPLPFDDGKISGCFSHMLYCMAFTSKELVNLTTEVHRVLKPNGLNIYTVRHTGDGDYKVGIHRGEDLYESNGFIVHFFSKDKIKQLSNGFEILKIDSFEEGQFPRKLFQVTLKKI